jgi:S-DNA-T family DNA segregation ATPase FtsK/SpoIIIE
MPQVWSALEYSCHFRDVLLSQRERLYLALVEDTPRFWSIYRDERVVLARYSDDSLEEVSREVDLAASLAARAFARLDDAQWQRRCVHGYPAPAQRTVAWLGRHTVHEAGIISSTSTRPSERPDPVGRTAARRPPPISCGH